MKKNLKLKIFFIAFLSIFLFLTAGECLAETCAEKYPDDGQCLTSCTSIFSPDITSGLCSSGQVCCHEYAAPAEINLQVPIFSYSHATGLADYIYNIAKFSMSLLILLSILVIFYAGIHWIISAGDPTKIKQAKNYIVNAIIGLTLGLLSVFIISLFGLNTLKNTQVTFIQNIPGEDGDFEQDVTTGLQTASQDCFSSTYGASESQVRANLVGIYFVKKNIQVHKLAQQAFTSASAQILSNGINTISSISTFSWRANVNNPSRQSLHSYGIAVDFNPGSNGNCIPRGQDLAKFKQLKSTYANDIGQICSHAKEFHCNCSLDIGIIRAMKNNGFKWGGEYKNIFDPMHFEWTGKCFN